MYQSYGANQIQQLVKKGVYPLEIQTWQRKIRGLLMSTIAVYMIVVTLDAMKKIYYMPHINDQSNPFS